MEAREDSKVGAVDEGGGGGTRGFSARGGGDVGAARRFCASACPARASLSVVRLEMNDLTLVLSNPPSSISSR
jgi:hypothetical protein